MKKFQLIKFAFNNTAFMQQRKKRKLMFDAVAIIFLLKNVFSISDAGFHT